MVELHCVYRRENGRSKKIPLPFERHLFDVPDVFVRVLKRCEHILKAF